MSQNRSTVHRPVLLRETLHAMHLQPGLIVVDGTVGAAGHSSEILPRIRPQGKLIGLDRDADMLARAATRLANSQTGTGTFNLPEEAQLVHSSYENLSEVLRELDLPPVDRILIDLGLSSDQLADPDRGFGFMTEGQLDMRFDLSQGEPVSEWLNRASVAEITTILTEFGEEPFAPQIAERIVQIRQTSPIQDVVELVRLIQDVYTSKGQKSDRSHPATRTFQALRIQVNAELQHLQHFLSMIAPLSLRPGGLLAVITFHSLEDRIVKQALANRQVWSDSSRKPIVASSLECKMNPRSRSAKLRIGIRAQ